MSNSSSRFSVKDSAALGTDAGPQTAQDLADAALAVHAPPLSALRPTTTTFGASSVFGREDLALSPSLNAPSSLSLQARAPMPVTAPVDLSGPAFATASAALKGGELSIFDTQLAALYYEHAAGATTAAAMAPFINSVQQFDSALQTVTVNGKPVQFVTIDVTAKDGDGAGLLAQLKDAGLANGASFGNMASGQIAVDKLGALLHVDNLGHAAESGVMFNVGTVTTQADHAMLVDDAREIQGGFLIDGAYQTVGLLSDSFNYLGGMATDVANDDLPGTTPYWGGYPTPTTTVLVDSGSTDEGRGMGQIVHDLAPGANIAFSTANGGQAAFAQHILDLAAAGATIISDDVTYFAETDYQNGPIAQAVEQVVAQGIPFFTSAGNDASKGLEIDGLSHSGHLGSFAEDLYNLTGTATPWLWGVHIPAYTSVTIVLNWSQPNAGTGPGAGGATSISTCTFITARELRFSRRTPRPMSVPIPWPSFNTTTARQARWTPISRLAISPVRQAAPIPARSRSWCSTTAREPRSTCRR